MKKVLALSIFIIPFIYCHSYAQDDASSDLPQPDWTFERVMRFYETDRYVFVIATIEDTVTYKGIWERAKSIKPDVEAEVKYENQLDLEDFQERMFICGTIQAFDSWDAFGLPIEKIPGGFRFGSYSFVGKDDGILFLSSDASRFVYAGNSLSAIDKLLRTIGGLFQYTIVADGVPRHFGNFVNNQFDPRGHIDLEKERSQQLGGKLESRYFVFHYSPQAMDIESLEIAATELDIYVEELALGLELDKPNYKIHAYIYSDENEKLLLSGHPGRGGITYGKEMHVLGLEPIEHETVHVLFNSEVSTANSNFFNEGIVSYYSFTTSERDLENAKEIVKKYLAEPIEEWANGSIYFFYTPSENGWPVAYPASGLFVKFLIDYHGLAKFKEFYKIADIEAGFIKTYGKSLTEMVVEWKSDDRSW